MNELPSAEFRKTYAKLTEQTLVTVNGHPIGVWLPGSTRNLEASIRHYDPPARPDPTIVGYPDKQSQRDELLRKINRG